MEFVTEEMDAAIHLWNNEYSENFEDSDYFKNLKSMEE